MGVSPPNEWSGREEENQVLGVVVEPWQGSAARVSCGTEHFVWDTAFVYAGLIGLWVQSKCAKVLGFGAVQ